MTKRTISESSQSWQTHKLLTFIILSKMNVAVGTTVKIAEGGGGGGDFKSESTSNLF